MKARIFFFISFNAKGFVRLSRQRSKKKYLYLKIKKKRCFVKKIIKSITFSKKSFLSTTVRVTNASFGCLSVYKYAQVRNQYFTTKSFLLNNMYTRRVRNKKFLHYDVYSRYHRNFIRFKTKRWRDTIFHKKQSAFYNKKLYTNRINVALTKKQAGFLRIPALRAKPFYGLFVSVCKNIEESLDLFKTKEFETELYFYIKKQYKKREIISSQDSEVDLYTGDVLYLGRLYYTYEVLFKFKKLLFPRKNLIMYRTRVREVQKAAKCRQARIESRLKVLNRVIKELKKPESFKGLKGLTMRKFLEKKKKKEQKKEDWYESWDNLLSLIRTFEIINDREKRLKEKAKKIQEIKKRKLTEKFTLKGYPPKQPGEETE